MDALVALNQDNAAIMDRNAFLLRHLLRAPASYRTALFASTQPHTLRTFSLLAANAPQARHLSVPRILQPSFWASMVPRPLKERAQQPRRREWNPATPYIILGLLVGSQAIQVLWLKSERGHALRRAEAKIDLLREVIRRVKEGEDVPVEELLGTGDPDAEREWAEVLRDVKDEQPLFETKKRRLASREAAAKEMEEERQGKEGMESAKSVESKASQVRVESLGGAKFY